MYSVISETLSSLAKIKSECEAEVKVKWWFLAPSTTITEGGKISNRVCYPLPRRSSVWALPGMKPCPPECPGCKVIGIQRCTERLCANQHPLHNKAMKLDHNAVC